MKKADSDTSEEDTKPPARDTTSSAAQAKERPVQKRRRPEEDIGSRKRPAVASLPRAAQQGASNPPTGTLKSPPAAAAPAVARRGRPHKKQSPPVPFGPVKKSKPRGKVQLQVMEEEVPKNETAEEKRLRRNRNNDRRKRARRAMKVDFLNEQYHTMKGQNETLKTENLTIRDQITAIKRAMGMEDVNPTTPSGGTAETDQEAEMADAEPTQASEVIASSVRSRLDGSIMAALNRQLSSPSSPPALQATTAPQKRTSESQQEAPQESPIQTSARAPVTVREAAGALTVSSQEQGANETSESAQAWQQQNQAVEAIMALIQRQQASAGAADVQQPSSPPHESTNMESNVEAALTSASPPAAASPGQNPNQVPQNEVQLGQTIESLLSSMQSSGGGQPVSLASLQQILASNTSIRPDAYQNAEILSLLQQQLGGGEPDVQRGSGGASGASEPETARRLLSALTRESQVNQDQDLAASLLNAAAGRPGETNEDPPAQGPAAPFIDTLQHQPSRDALMSVLQPFQDGGAASDVLSSISQQPQGAAYAMGALLQRMQESLTQTTSQEHSELRSPVAQQPTGAGSSVESIAALLQEHRPSSSGGGTSSSPTQGSETLNSLTPEVLAALQQLQGPGGSGLNLSRLNQGRQSESRAAIASPASSQSRNHEVLELVESLRRRHREDPSIQGILSKLQGQLSEADEGHLSQSRSQPSRAEDDIILSQLQNQLIGSGPGIASQHQNQPSRAGDVMRSQLQSQPSESGQGVGANQGQDQSTRAGDENAFRPQDQSSEIMELLNQLQSQLSGDGEGILTQLQNQLVGPEEESASQPQNQRNIAEYGILSQLLSQSAGIREQLQNQLSGGEELFGLLQQAGGDVDLLGQLQNQLSGGGDLLPQLQDRLSGSGDLVRQLENRASGDNYLSHQQQNQSSGDNDLLNQLQGQWSGGVDLMRQLENQLTGAGGALSRPQQNQPSDDTGSGDLLSLLLRQAQQGAQAAVLAAPAAPSPPPAANNDLVQQILANQGLLGGQAEADAVAAAAASAETTPADLALAQSILSAVTGNTSIAVDDPLLLRELISGLGVSPPQEQSQHHGLSNPLTNQAMMPNSTHQQSNQSTASAAFSPAANPQQQPTAGAPVFEMLQQRLQQAQHPDERRASAQIHSLPLQQHGGSLPSQGQPQAPQPQGNPFLQLLTSRLLSGGGGLGAASSLSSQVTGHRLHSSSRIRDPPSSPRRADEGKDSKEDSGEEREGDKRA
ncbi:expressed unknown protein [Seminavis robusta]|uniref:BZIP domain-containing protein n=1 Tax=Seminavis robusta TaxID=568900 RepID=A0A9N8DZ03_9STRA|nr:expressed unknown protein [Seminavis robusta]|eukprot:Sro488_g153160.1 n/a (1246) ;mRNA; f:51066-54803